MAREQRRVQAEDVKNNLREGMGSGIASLLALPRDVRLWQPEKAGTYTLDFVTYIVTSPNHPDNKNGRLELDPKYDIHWWKRPFQVHRKIGANGEMLISPLTIGKPDPIWEERQLLAQNYKQNEAAVKATTPQRWMAFPIIDPDDSDKIAIFAMSYGKFWEAKAGLEYELGTSTDDSKVGFYNFVDGKTLKVRFADQTYEGRKYLECNRIDFVDREDMDEKEILAKVPALDDMFVILPYDKLKALYLQTDLDASGSTEADETPRKTTSTKKSTTVAEKPAAEPEKPAKAGFKNGDKVIFRNDDGLVIAGKIVDIDGKIISIKGPDGKEHDVDVKSVQLASDVKEEPKADPKPAKTKKAVEPEPEPESEDDDGLGEGAAGEFEIGQKVSFKNKKGKVVKGTITEVDGDDITITDAEGGEYIKGPDDLTAEEVDPDVINPLIEFKVGDRAKDEDGTEGTIVKVNKDSVTLKTSDGNIIVPFSEVMVLNDAVEHEDPNGPELKVGDVVLWDDGSEEGTVMKIDLANPKKPRAKVKDDTDTLLWKTFDELTLKPKKAAKKK